MKYIFLLLFQSIAVTSWSQKIHVPDGVVYKYCDSVTLKKGVNKIMDELSANPKYDLDLGITFIGPTLWTRIKTDENLSKIKGGDMIITGIDRKKPSGKATSKKEDCKLVWDFIRNEIGKKRFVLRKATYNELVYYWSVTAFDIEEPLIIVETAEHKYIMNLDPKELKLTWLDEVPVNN